MSRYMHWRVVLLYVTDIFNPYTHVHKSTILIIKMQHKQFACIVLIVSLSIAVAHEFTLCSDVPDKLGIGAVTLNPDPVQPGKDVSSLFLLSLRLWSNWFNCRSFASNCFCLNVTNSLLLFLFKLLSLLDDEPIIIYYCVLYAHK